jgi:hypothetical protein
VDTPAVFWVEPRQREGPTFRKSDMEEDGGEERRALHKLLGGRTLSRQSYAVWLCRICFASRPLRLQRELISNEPIVGMLPLGVTRTMVWGPGIALVHTSIVASIVLP